MLSQNNNKKKTLPTVFDIKAVKADYGEETQKFNVFFAWGEKVGDKYRQMHHWVRCRDFLGDWIWFVLNDKKDDIYGFKLTEDAVVSDLLGVKFPRIAHLKQFEENAHLFSDFFNIIKKEGRSVLLVLSPDTMKYLWRISLASFLVKCAAAGHIKDIESLATMDLPNNEHCYRELLGSDNLVKLVSNWKTYNKEDKDIRTKKSDDLYFIHNKNGFVSTFREGSDNEFRAQFQ